MPSMNLSYRSQACTTEHYQASVSCVIDNANSGVYYIAKMQCLFSCHTTLTASRNCSLINKLHSQLHTLELKDNYSLQLNLVLVLTIISNSYSMITLTDILLRSGKTETSLQQSRTWQDVLKIPQIRNCML